MATARRVDNGPTRDVVAIVGCCCDGGGVLGTFEVELAASAEQLTSPGSLTDR